MKSKNWPVIREKLVELDELIVVLSGLEGEDLDAPFTEEEKTRIQEAIDEGCLLITLRRNQGADQPSKEGVV